MSRQSGWNPQTRSELDGQIVMSALAISVCAFIACTLLAEWVSARWMHVLFAGMAMPWAVVLLAVFAQRYLPRMADLCGAKRFGSPFAAFLLVTAGVAATIGLWQSVVSLELRLERKSHAAPFPLGWRFMDSETK
ncbi:MAG: hypothetical protein HY078_14560 [Elusimicrobia bacterium]|nr:hypothetical protein [Elusimicrobiota bacterium]